MNYNETTLLMSAMVMLRGALADISDARDDIAAQRLHRALEALRELKEGEL